MTTTEPQGGSTDHHTVFQQAQTTKPAETGPKKKDKKKKKKKKKGRGISTQETDEEEEHMELICKSGARTDGTRKGPRNFNRRT